MFGDKVRAKKLAKKKGLPVLDSFLVKNLSRKEIKNLLETLSFPCLIKAACGGGGRGMRVVSSKGELEEALLSAAREAESSFGDSSLYLEPYLQDVKHIEVQIACDVSGDVVHFFDRECSYQRRHQKVIEEAPSTAPMSLRKKLYQAAQKLFFESGYVGLATVEFLVDKNGRFYFLEVNPRLQVEHPVTEKICDVDLVEIQIKLAEGHLLKELCTTPIKAKGYAVEARLCAESIKRNLMPNSGQIKRFILPGNSKNVRVDLGYREGNVIPVFYDSLIAKIIGFGEDREKAIKNLLSALTQIKILGVETNLALLIDLLLHKGFQSGFYFTNTLEERLHSLKDVEEQVWVLPVIYVVQWIKDKKAEKDIWYMFSLSLNKQDSLLRFSLDGSSYTVQLQRVINENNEEERYKAKLVEEKIELNIQLLDSFGEWIKAVVEGRVLYMRRLSLGTEGEDFWGKEVFIESSAGFLTVYFGESSSGGKGAGEAKADERNIYSELPGKVIKLYKRDGERVKVGETVIVMESMKMEHPIEARSEGVLKLLVKDGQQVNQGQCLAKIIKGKQG